MNQQQAAELIKLIAAHAEQPLVKALGIAADIAIVLTAFFIWFQLRHSVLVKETRKVRAHERIAQWNEPHFVQRREGVLRYLRNDSIPNDEKVQRFSTDDAFGAVVTQILNFFDALGQAVADEVVDEKSARVFFEGIVESVHVCAQPILRHYRKDDPEALNYFSDLARRWATGPVPPSI